MRCRGPHHDEALRALGRAVRELRARNDLSQEDLRKRVDMHRNYVGTVERGEANLGVLNLLRLVNALGVPFPEFVEVWERQLRALQGLQRAGAARVAHQPTRQHQEAY